MLTSRLTSEDWLSYVGIGLLLFGFAFLFEYSIEQEGLVPMVRVGFGHSPEVYCSGLDCGYMPTGRGSGKCS